ncbi:MAG: [Clostridia bacterium]|nr:[FeFe] hydrogenase H-cluster maturation GTPase HydF [Clostridia bacterium]
MSLNSTPSGQRIHIAFFGRRNAGKSSLINAVTGQNLSIVSSEKGTTTDPVKKAMELLPLGPVVIIDTAGIDDEGDLGKLRVEKSMEVLNSTDIAVVVTEGITKYEKKLIDTLEKRNIPYIICYNKSDINTYTNLKDNEIAVSAVQGNNIDALKNMLGRFIKPAEKPLISDLINEGDMVILVTPIDESAPKGRIILPQQMVIRDILDSHATAVVCQTQELKNTLNKLKENPKLVVCDSQVFGKVAKDLPEDIPLTSFSVLMLRYKLDISVAKEGSKALDRLRDGDTLLISEGCTHHRQCKDIGTVKLPLWIREYTGKKLEFEFTSGGEFPKTVKKYALVVHCGGCMLNDAAIKSRMELCKEEGVPFTNYGVVISKVNGILDRAVRIFE